MPSAADELDNGPIAETLPDGTVLTREGDPTEPDPEFWELYSPNFEMPISWVSGLLVVAMMFAAVVLIVRYGDGKEDKTGVPIVLDPDGGMDDSGDGKLGGGGTENPPVIADFQSQPSKEDISAVLPDNTPLPEVKDDLVKKIQKEDPSADVAFTDAKAAVYKSLSEDVRNKMLGIGGQKGDPGPGKGEGPNQPGDGGRGASGTRARSLRWVLQFKTFSGRDYLDQLAAIGAEVAIPLPPDNNNLLLFRNLKNPGKGERMTEAQLLRLSGQMQFADIKRDSVRSVAEALGLDFAPNSFWAFFPKGAEEELAKLEKGYNNRQPEDIAETKFRVEIVNGRYRFVVSEQTLKR